MAQHPGEIIVRLTEVEEVSDAIEAIGLQRTRLRDALSNVLTAIRHDGDVAFWAARGEMLLREIADDEGLAVVQSP